MEQETTEVRSVVGAPLVMMPDPVCSQKETGFGPHFLLPMGPESSNLDSAIVCVENNSSKAPTAASIISVPKSGQVLVRTYVSNMWSFLGFWRACQEF